MEQKKVVNNSNANTVKNPVNAQKNAKPVVNDSKNVANSKDAKNAKPVVKTPLESVKIKKIGVLSFANTIGVIYAFIGLLIGLTLSILSLVVSDLINAGSFGIFVGVWAALILPVVYGIMGFITGAITGLIYNISAKLTGGIELLS